MFQNNNKNVLKESSANHKLLQIKRCDMIANKATSGQGRAFNNEQNVNPYRKFRYERP